MLRMILSLFVLLSSPICLPSILQLWTSFVSVFLFPLFSFAFSVFDSPVYAYALPVFLLASLLISIKKRTPVCLFACVLFTIALWLPFYLKSPFPKEENADPVDYVSLCISLSQKAEEAYTSFIPSSLVPERSKEAVKSLFPNRIIGARPKFSKAGTVLKRFSAAGIFLPFTGEAVISPVEPDIALPFTACHELSHRLGFFHEGDANLTAFYACILSEYPEFRYSGYLHALKYAYLRIPASDTEALEKASNALPEKIMRDLLRLGAFDESARDTSAFPPFAGDYGDMTEKLIYNERNKKSLGILIPSDPTA